MSPYTHTTDRKQWHAQPTVRADTTKKSRMRRICHILQGRRNWSFTKDDKKLFVILRHFCETLGDQAIIFYVPFKSFLAMASTNNICVSISPHVQREKINSRIMKAMVQISIHHWFIIVILLRSYKDTSGLGSPTRITSQLWVLLLDQEEIYIRI